MDSGNREHKDRLFTYLFGAEENRAWTLSLFNAVAGTSYTDPSEITITTIREIMYLGAHNDLSFLMAGMMNLYEQQSTYNPNMPARMLEYLADLYAKLMADLNISKYSRRLNPLPVPKLVVFYNGTDAMPDEKILSLKDAFSNPKESDVDVTVRMLNINLGHNRKLMASCKPLEEYAWLVAEIRKNVKRKKAALRNSARRAVKKGQEPAPKVPTKVILRYAIDRAIADMPEGFEIKHFLLVNQAEVNGMLLTEFDYDYEMRLIRRDEREEGERREREKTIANLLKTHTPEWICNEFSWYSPEEVYAVQAKLAVEGGSGK